MLNVFKQFLEFSDETLIRMGQKSREIAEELFDKDALDDLYLLYNIKYIFFILSLNCLIKCNNSPCF